MSHYVYRVFDAEGALLYIGCTGNVENRLAQHRHKGTLGGRYARHEVTEYAERSAARAAESAAIAAERPLLNVQHQKADPVCAAEVRAAISRVRARKSDIAAAVGMSANTMSRKLHARARFTQAELEAIAAVLGVPVERMGEPVRPWLTRQGTAA